ncbi:hypothetical protein BZM27_47325 [Paraburkholderia steynii]|uniref:NADPH-dependent FMN reductase-like domain-containing protein n=1 Tax=Paraburkholderia steynii TaxID=1245441 RepID=A0A4R0X1B9_9BURK|nr:hypothetical protein BZM27_47325 [Paraburkholderia steynii]
MKLTRFDQNRRPLVIGIGGTTRAASSTERALGFALRGAEQAGARTRLFGGTFLHSLPHYAPESTQRTAEQIELIEAVRHADALIIATPGYHGGVSGLVKNVARHARRTACRRAPIPRRPRGRLHRHRVWVAGGGLGADVAALHRSRVARLADAVRRRHQHARNTFRIRRYLLRSEGGRTTVDSRPAGLAIRARVPLASRLASRRRRIHGVRNFGE